MNTCHVCGKPIPRTKRVCEECEEGITPLDTSEEDGKKEPDDILENEEEE